MIEFDIIRKAIADYKETFQACAVDGSASENNWERYRAACQTLELNEQRYPNYGAVYPKMLLNIVLSALNYIESVDGLIKPTGL